MAVSLGGASRQLERVVGAVGVERAGDVRGGEEAEGVDAVGGGEVGEADARVAALDFAG